jgi:hypothetical protein
MTMTSSFAPMPKWSLNRCASELTDERFEARFEHGPLDRHASDRVRPVADDHRHIVPLRCPQAVGHGVDVGVDPGADILKVDHDRVQAGEHLGGRLARFTVERVDGHLPSRVLGVGRLDHVLLQVRPEAVLRAEDGADPDAGRLGAFDDVLEAGVDRRRVAHEAYRAATQQLAVEQDIGTEDERHGRHHTGSPRVPTLLT